MANTIHESSVEAPPSSRLEQRSQRGLLDDVWKLALETSESTSASVFRIAQRARSKILGRAELALILVDDVGIARFLFLLRAVERADSLLEETLRRADTRVREALRGLPRDREDVTEPETYVPATIAISSTERVKATAAAAA